MKRALLWSLVVAGVALAQAPSDIPGAGGGNYPNVLVVFDNSRSMLSPPNSPFDQTCAPRDDFWVLDGGIVSIPEFPLMSWANTGAPGACENAAQPADKTRCRNKLCIGKSVMYDALDSYADLVQIGFASYYQYLRKIDYQVGPSKYSQCEYDVIASPGEWARQTDHLDYGVGPLALTPYVGAAEGAPVTFYPLKDYTGSSSCYPTKWLHSCVDTTPLTASLDENAKTCTWTGRYNLAQTYADKVYASSTVGPHTGALTTANNTATFPTGASSFMATWTNDGTHPENASSEMLTYYLFDKALYPATGPVAGLQETGPFTANCGTTYPSNATYVTNSTANGPTGAGGSDHWRITDGRTAGGWRDTTFQGLQAACSAAEPCDFTRVWERKVEDRYIQYNSSQVKDVETACAGGASCVNSNQTRLYIARLPGLYKGGGNSECNAPGNYTGGPLNGGTLSECGTKTLAQSCQGTGGTCQISAGNKKGPYPQRHYTYDNTTSLDINYLDGTPVAMTQGPTVYAEGWYTGPINGGACPGGDAAGTVTNQSFPTSPTWSNPPPPAAFNTPDAGVFGCTAAGANDYEPIRFVTDTLDPSLIPPVRRSTTCTVEFVKHDLQTDTGINRCYYKFHATEWTGGGYQCEYELRQWQYDCNPRFYCGWQKQVYQYKPKYFTTRWQTTGGELIGRIRPADARTRSNTDNFCNDGWNDSGAGSLNGGKCPATIDATYDPRCTPGRICRLKWVGPRSTNGTPATEDLSGKTITRGRLHNFAGANKDAWAGTVFNNDSANKFCRVPDFAFTGAVDPEDYLLVPQALPADGNSWCWGADVPSYVPPSQIDVLSDPYSPTLNKDNALGSMFPKMGDFDPYGAGDNRQVSDIKFSLDGVTWHDQPPTKQKTIGWSYLNKALGLGGGLNGGYASDVPALDFVRFDVGSVTVPQIKQMMSAYDPVLNPRGLKVPSRVSNQNTPLYGSMSDVHDYLKYIMDNDPAAKCREYAVLLVTDGFEEQPLSLTGQWRNMAFDNFNNSTDLNKVIATVRDTSGSNGAPPNKVRTFVVGFGDGLSTGPQSVLDQMAQTAGTSIPDAFGVQRAYTAVSPNDFRLKIGEIFANIVGGRYTRSKPVVAQTGTETYYGFFEFFPGSPEWKGYLNRYNTADFSGTGVPVPVWSFDLGLNGQASTTRRVLAPLSNGSVVDLVQYSAMAAADKTALQTDLGAASPAVEDAIVNFVLNPTLDAPFNNGKKRVSRIGDVYHSVPTVVGGQPPFQSAWAGDDSAEQTAYDTWRNSLVARPVRVMIGANDGQMHAVCEQGSTILPCGNGTTTAGSESWSFIPPAALKNLDKMRANHTFTVDGSFTAADICLPPGCDVATNWKTVLLGSMRQGGNRIFALDVTDVDTPKYLFDFGNGAMGETWSPPTVAKLKVGSGETWAAVVGGGVSATAEVGNAVMIVDMKTQSLVTDGLWPASWRVDQNPVGCSGSCLPKNNFPGRAALVRNAPQAPYIQQIFFGDTQGIITRMNTSSPVVSTWAPQVFFDPAAGACKDSYLTGGPADILDADTGSVVGTLPISIANRHSIYQRPTTVKDQYSRNTTFVGTGDITNPSTTGTYDYYYAILDTNGADVNNYCGGETLWVKRFAKGQKVLSEGAVAGTVVFVPTYIPSTDPCSPGGDSVIYAFDRTNGTPTNAFQPPPGSPAGTKPSNKTDVPGGGIPPDLTFIPNPSDPTGATGKLIVGTKAFDVNVGTYGSLVRGFRRVK